MTVQQQLDRLFRQACRGLAQFSSKQATFDALAMERATVEGLPVVVTIAIGKTMCADFSETLDAFSKSFVAKHPQGVARAFHIDPPDARDVQEGA